MAKTVCIVGAGPAGIVAAKTLLYEFPKGSFDVTVFEQSSVGGLWPTSKTDTTRIHPELRTNLSCLTVSFSDLAWPEKSPPFPKAWQVGQYLQRYLAKYPIPVRTGHRVTKAARAGNQWTVETNEKTSHVFDHLVVASGFFGKPRIPEIAGLDELRAAGVPVIHSLNYQQLPTRGQNVVVIGGQMSGAETAAAVALQISSAAHSPGETPTNKKVHQVFKHPFWVLPTFLPTSLKDEKNPATPFLPIDLVMYDLARRPPGEIKNQSGYISEPAAEAIHNYLETVIGSNQKHLGLEINNRKLAPRVAIADRYAEFVRSGLIQLHQGTATYDGELRVSDGSSISDVAAVILATGFDSCGSLSYLPDDVLQTLEYNTSSPDLPLVLDCASTVNKKIPNLGFVGFYRGPYWGGMEMQARFLGKLWTGDDKVNAQLTLTESPIIHLREVFHNEPKRLAQFPMGDYIYMMESMSDILGIGSPNGTPIRPRDVPAIPSMYLMPGVSDESLNQSGIARTMAYHYINDSIKGRFVSKAVFNGLQGDWLVRRSIVSTMNTLPSGTFHGKVAFHPRMPTGDNDAEYLYIEEGDFTTETGLQFKANRRYVYRYCDETDIMSAWFVKPDDDKTVDYLFHEAEILPPVGRSGWRAKSYHLCIKDHYDVHYEFRFKGAALDVWSLGYTVRGPQKDYKIESSYRRP